MNKILTKRTQMREVAEQHRQRGIEIKILEAENPESGRIIWVRKGKTILVMR